MKTYEYDCANSLGDTVMEKFEALYHVLADANRADKIRFAIGHPNVTSIIEVATYGFTPSPIIADMGNISYAGNYGTNINYSTNINFALFKSKQVAENELVLFGETGNAVVRFVNYF